VRKFVSYGEHFYSSVPTKLSECLTYVPLQTKITYEKYYSHKSTSLQVNNVNLAN